MDGNVRAGGRRAGGSAGFSLTEVAVAVGIFSLAMASLLGLMSIAISTQGDSVMQTLAANTAAEIVSRRRAAPEAETFDVEGGGTGKLIVPPLSEITAKKPSFGGNPENQKEVGATGFVVDESGETATAIASTRFLCEYRGWRQDSKDEALTGNRLYVIHLRLLWPIDVARNNPRAADSYEILTMIASGKGVQ